MGIHAALAVHPDSGHGAAARIAGTVAGLLREHVDRLDLLVATSVTESRELMRRSRDAGLDVLFVLGGDGAAHQGVQFCAGTDVVLGLIPAGTGNDLVRALGLPGEPLAATGRLIDALRTGSRHRIDLGRTGDTWFGTVLCSGFDACVNERANRMRWPSGPRRYDLAILGELARFGTRPVCLRTETETLELEATLVAVGNTGTYGGGIPICPDADLTDGWLDVTVIGRTSRLELLRMLPSLRKGTVLDHPAARTLRVREIAVQGASWPVYADGESLGELPARVHCVPGALTVLGERSARPGADVTR